METALQIVAWEKLVDICQAARAESEFPAQICGVKDGRVKAEGAEDGMNMAVCDQCSSFEI